MRSAPMQTRNLRGAARTFWRFPTPWVLSTLLGGTIAARAAVGQWRWWQLLLVAVVVGAQPFVEWVLHVTVLHARPLIVAGRVLDLYVARKHREHHADPRSLAGSFIPPRVLGYLLVLIAVICWTVPGWPARLTAGATMLSLGLL